LLGGLVLLIATGLAEELLFRGIIQKNAEDVLGMGIGLLYTSLLFTSLHIGWNSVMDLLFVFGVAMFYGYAFQKTRSLLGITVSHGISNSVLFLVMPFLIF
ncbi:MAG TPA: CPBP family intramembrane glutamic endopeptidase, partial [Methanobacteriaceae archaeon]|nr:CPBP family intramembrane glutamic endopeptidase [Methanobacteriaceae archaeon]